MNPNIRLGSDNGKPIIVSDPETDAAKALKLIAESVAARISVAALSGNNAPTINIA